MASKNCRRNDIEKQQHERAVKVRKMTDVKLCEYLESLRSDKPCKDEKAVINDFLSYVYNQPCNGIGRGIMARLKAELDNYCVM
ncbi:MAG: hypothetical protein Q4D26_12135 [Clostridia bacterium]|nr:hypothetical protein [Clostridia bacterium]